MFELEVRQIRPSHQSNRPNPNAETKIFYSEGNTPMKKDGRKGRAKVENLIPKKSNMLKDPKFTTTTSANQPIMAEVPYHLAGNSLAPVGNANEAHPEIGRELAEMIAEEIGDHLPHSGV